MDKVNGRITTKQTVAGSVISKQEVTGNVVGKQTVTGKLGMPTMGVTDYNMLTNKPSIENVTLVGDKSIPEFGDRTITNLEIQSIINNVFS